MHASPATLHLRRLQARLQEPSGFGGYGEIQHWLAEHWGEEISYAQVHRLVYRRLKVKLKPPRHPQKTSPPRRFSRSASSEG